MPGGFALRPVLGTGAIVLVLAGCEPGADTRQEAQPPRFHYLGVETRLLDDDLVNVHVRMRGARGREDVADYAECAAAQYALIRGYGFARHVRTNVQEEAGLWRADAVYTVSPALPRGVRTIDAEVVVAACAEQGIPTV